MGNIPPLTCLPISRTCPYLSPSRHGIPDSIDDLRTKGASIHCFELKDSHIPFTPNVIHSCRQWELQNWFLKALSSSVSQTNLFPQPSPYSIASLSTSFLLKIIFHSAHQKKDNLPQTWKRSSQKIKWFVVSLVPSLHRIQVASLIIPQWRRAIQCTKPMYKSPSWDFFFMPDHAMPVLDRVRGSNSIPSRAHWVIPMRGRESLHPK